MPGQTDPSQVDLSQVEDGFQTPGVICKSCGVALAVVNDPATIPASFRIRCPTCTHDDAYAKADVTAVVVRRKGPEAAPNH